MIGVGCSSHLSAQCECNTMNQMETVRAKALLFDMDGVLINSIPAVTRVWSRWAEEHGFDPKEVVHRAHGRPSITTLRELLPNGDYEAENRRIEQAEMEDLEGIVPLPGARELLLLLPLDGWAIVTSCTRPLAEVRIRTAGLPTPGHLITSSDITQGKPHPEPYLKGAASLGVSATDCIVIEDVPAGITSGKNAGARVIALRTTTTEGELRAARADWVLQNCAAIHFRGRVDGDLELDLAIAGI
jgi:mannitol-1-/sugar-/sorbitol-6-phosphatase